VGAAAVVDRASRDLPSGTICLAFGQGGYVGRVRLGDDRMCVAAAVDPALLRRQGPLGALQGLLAACGAEELPGAPHLHVLGTLPLTRRARHVAAERLLLVGDACGYVEPLTGEGMAAAIDLALAAAPLAAEIAGSAWHGRFARAWRQTVRRSTLPRSLVCRALTGVARRPPLASAALAAVSWSPRTAARAVARMTHGAPSAAQGNPA
jgi:flavin-dependent dehydrogenase